MSDVFDPVRSPMWDAPDAVTFRDTDGVSWRVVEWGAARVPGARGTRCLIFLAEGIARRVWRYPPDWRERSAAELEALVRERPGP